MWSKERRAAAGAVAAVLVVAVLLHSPRTGLPAEPEGSLPIADPRTHWAGYTEIVPPIRLPSDADGQGEIEVLVQLPAEGAIRTGDDGALIFPPGTTADRVEYRGGSVVDVRGTTLTEDGELFHVYRPLGQEPHGPLFGFEWRRGDREAQRDATSRLREAVQAGLGFAPGERPEAQADRDATAQRLAEFNQCDRCHEHRRAERTSAVNEPTSPRRGTDGSGFFVTAYALRDAAPLERHRALEQNHGNPFVLLACADGAKPAFVKGTGHLACADGSVPTGTYRLAEALAAGDPHAARVCASRRFLYERLDARGREIHAAAVAACPPAAHVTRTP